MVSRKLSEHDRPILLSNLPKGVEVCLKENALRQPHSLLDSIRWDILFEETRVRKATAKKK